MAKQVSQTRSRAHLHNDVSMADDMPLQNFLSLGKIAAGLIHDLINPIMALRFHMETLEKHASRYLSEDDFYHLEQSMRIIGTMEEYIRIARDAMQLKTVVEKFVVADEIKKTCQLLTNSLLNARIALYIQCNVEFCIIGNRTKFNRILMNILSNAIDAYDTFNTADEHGKTAGVLQTEKKILIYMEKSASRDVRAVSHDSNAVTSTQGDSSDKVMSADDVSDKSDDVLVLRITDYGKGMTTEQSAHIFEPFYSTKKSNTGMGIGLFTVKEIIEKDFGGSIHFESIPDQGTTCTLLFSNNVPSVGIEPTSQA